MLNNAGYEDLIFATSAKEAFLILGMAVGKPDPKDIELILMDLFMPGMDGIETCRRIKAFPTLHDIPLLMVTAATEQENLEMAFEAGVNDYITKPPGKVELLARIRSALALKSEIDQKKIYAKELEELNKKLERLSMVDGLTGIANRRSFDEYIERMWALGTRNDMPLSLILIDIDNFKKYNDTLGHIAGDECLKQVTATISNSLKRPADFVARYGGDEIVVLLPKTNLEGALNEAGTILRAVEGLNLFFSDPPSPTESKITISLGVSCMVPDREKTYRELIESADKALYQAKKAGNNCIKTGT